MSRTLAREDLVLDRRTYLEQVRPALRARIIPMRAARRVRLGDSISCEFESADTLLYQVQEMLVVEGSTDDAAVEHELASYARLLPSPDSFTCTFFYEADDVTSVREELLALTGLQHSLSLVLAPAGAATLAVPGVEVPGLGEDGPSTLTQAVHFLRFTLDAAARAALSDPATPVELVVDHPGYAAATPLRDDLRGLLLADLGLDG